MYYCQFKILIRVRYFWSKMLVESVATFTLVTGKNSVLFTPALDPRYLLHFTELYSNCVGTNSKACTHRDLISTLLGGFKLHVKLVFSFVCLWPQGT